MPQHAKGISHSGHLDVYNLLMSLEMIHIRSQAQTLDRPNKNTSIMLLEIRKCHLNLLIPLKNV